MEKKLQGFLNQAFAPYGNFPARKDVEQELLANLVEKYNDLKEQGKTDDEAYQATVDSFGDVSEIMEQVEHTDQPRYQEEDKRNLRTILKDSILHPIQGNYQSRFLASSLMDADLAGTKLSGADFSMSALMGADFAGADLSQSKFKAAALKGASFEGANLNQSRFDSSDLTETSLKNANLTNGAFRRCAFKNANFAGAILDNTEFNQSDLSEVAFDGLSLTGTIFNGSSLKKATFKNTKLENVSFHHSEVKKAVFDGATMDKITYALLKGAKANLDNVIVQ
jgi:uncharacterized protein YjbI with pentapeptide repeats